MYEWNWQWSSYLSYHNFSDRYEMYPDGIIKFSFIKSFKKVHIDRLIARYIIDYLKTILRNDHRYETLVELKHSDIAVYLLKRYNRVEIDKAWNSIRIALKNNYDFNQGGRNDSCDLWFDELNNLIELKLDTRSPKYVCPENLVEAHNQHNAQIAKIRAKKELEKQRLESIEDNVEYIKSHEKYFKKIIETDKFIIKPLKNVEEFYEEGTLMHHCLFTQKYYRFKDSLILSIREKENNARLETCEIDLKEKKIRQCYGMFDKFTEYHDDILKAVAKNIPVLLR